MTFETLNVVHANITLIKRLYKWCSLYWFLHVLWLWQVAKTYGCFYWKRCDIPIHFPVLNSFYPDLCDHLLQCYNGGWGSWKININWHSAWTIEKGINWTGYPYVQEWNALLYFWWLNIVSLYWNLINLLICMNFVLYLSRFNVVDQSCGWLSHLLPLKQSRCLTSSKWGFLLFLLICNCSDFYLCINIFLEALFIELVFKNCHEILLGK